MISKYIAFLLSLLFISLAGCKRDKIETYRIPKEVSQAEGRVTPPAMDSPAANPATTPANPTAAPAFVWTFPEDWTEQTGTSAMRQASYRTPGGGDYSIVELVDSDDLSNVNRWLRQLGREPIDEQALGPLVQHLEFNGRHFHVFNLQGAPGDDRAMLAGIYREGGRAWFFKLDATPEEIEAQEQAFLDVLASMRRGASAAAAPAPAPATTPSPAPSGDSGAGGGNMQVLPGMEEQVSGIPDATWSAPAAWTEVEGSPIRKATYAVGEGAELAITAFPGDVGGLEANINRWRRQIGLPPASPDEMAAFTQSLQVDGFSGTMMYFSRDPENPESAALLGLVVELPGATWFFKMTGPAQELRAERERFEQFAETIAFNR